MVLQFADVATCGTNILRAITLVSGMDQKISKAWQQAAVDLGIRVVAPFELASEDGSTRWLEAHILDFGGPMGTIVASKSTRLSDLKLHFGYYPSILYPNYQTYARKLFIETLDDWGWYGEFGKEPAWYTGQPWS